MQESDTLVITTPGEPLAPLRAVLGGEALALPAVDAPGDFEAWRDRHVEGAPASRVVVAQWLDAPGPVRLNDLDGEEWARRFEYPWYLWHFALAAAARRCRDGGAVVAVAQAPALLDAAGLTPETSIAHGVLALVRSLAASEGPRGVRVNLVTTPIGLVDGEVIDPPPPLPGHPHSLADVGGAVRMLLGDDAGTVTGRLIPADGGRTI